MLAATPDDAYNALVCTRFAPELGRERVHQLAMDRTGARHQASREWRGKIVVGEEMTFQRLADLMQSGASLVAERHHQAMTDAPASTDDGWPVAIIRQSGELAFVGAEHAATPADDDTVIQLHRAALVVDPVKGASRWHRLLCRRTIVA